MQLLQLGCSRKFKSAQVLVYAISMPAFFDVPLRERPLLIFLESVFLAAKDVMPQCQRFRRETDVFTDEPMARQVRCLQTRFPGRALIDASAAHENNK